MEGAKSYMTDSPTAQATPLTPELSQALPLRKNFAWTLTGNVVYAGCQWGMLMAIAKLGTPAMLGQFALGFAIAGPVFIMAQLHLRAVQATDARHEYLFGHYFALRILGTAAALALVAAIAYFSGFRRQTALIVLAVGLAKAAESLSDVIYGLWQKRERLDQIAVAMMGRGVGSLVALATTLYLTGSIVLAVGAMALWWAFWLATYERGVAWPRACWPAGFSGERMAGPDWGTGGAGDSRSIVGTLNARCWWARSVI